MTVYYAFEESERLEVLETVRDAHLVLAMTDQPALTYERDLEEARQDSDDTLR